jgi:hypothetical protein
MGLFGAPLLITSTVTVLFGIIEPISPWAAIATLPVALWELSPGLWMTVKGFQPSAVTAGMTAAATPSADRDVAAV